MSGSTLTPPANDELEITLFGPGCGECIVVHIGNGSWLIVDSCVDRDTNQPMALKYLESLNVDVSCQVKDVVITHWHDDHIRGISKIAEKCARATFYLSAALMSSQDSDKFKKLVLDSSISRLANLNADTNSGVSEFSKVFEIIKERNSHLKFALQDTLLIGEQSTELWALAPHSTTFEKAINGIIAQIPDKNGCVQRLKAPKPNHSSVVLWLKFGKVRALFGADLEESAEHKGWSLIISEKKSSVIDQKAEVFKVAHHGSRTGDHDSIWSELLGADPLCLIAPYSRNPKLPKTEDVQRINSYSNNAYITSDTIQTAQYKDSEDKHVKRRLIQRKASYVHAAYSYVRIRKKLNEDWKIETYGNACHLSAIKGAA